jgi:hypothetical protein
MGQSNTLQVFYKSANERAAKFCNPEHLLHLFAALPPSMANITLDRSVAERSKTVYLMGLRNPYRISRESSKMRGGGGVCVFDSVDREILRNIVSNGGALLLDLATEIYPISDDFAAYLYQGIREAELPLDAVNVISGGRATSETFDQIRQKLGLPEGPKVVPFHGCLWRLVNHNRPTPGHRIAIQERLHGVQQKLASSQRGDAFVSFNGRLRPHRFYAVLWLYAQGLLEKGRASFLGYTTNVADQGSQLEHLTKVVTQFAGSDAKMLLQRLEEFMRRLPLQLDVDKSAVVQTAEYKTQLPWDSPASEFYDNAYFSIVIDASIQAGVLFLTPIAFKSFMNLSPFVYVGNRHALAEMRRLGFETFSPIIDESYDDIEDGKARVNAALREAQRLANLPLDELHSRYQELMPRLVHNYQYFFASADRFPGVFKNEVLTPLGF